ncbi:MAG: hypothetical protein IJC07_03320 [Clostridia bacterium]|nr:hypothetical protein [Clostridia bacterium]
MAVKLKKKEKTKKVDEEIVETLPALTEADSKRKKSNDFYQNFTSFCSLLNDSEENVKQELYLYLIKKFMANVGKAVVRFGDGDNKLEKIFLNCMAQGVGGVYVAPAHLPAVKKIINKNADVDIEVVAVVDFPFGESTLKARLNEVKDCKRANIDGVLITMPNVLTLPDKVKEYKKQAKKLLRAFNGKKGFAFNAGDLSDQDFSRVIKFTEKSKADYVALLFGESDYQTVKEKIEKVQTLRAKKKIFVLANVDKEEIVKELIKLGVDKVLTPFADDIGKNLFERYQITSIKLR